MEPEPPKDYNRKDCPYRWGLLHTDSRCVEGSCAMWIIIRSFTHEGSHCYEWGCGLVHRPRK